MGTIVMKEAPDVDFYVGWSSVVEAPVFWGSRTEVIGHLKRDSDPWLREDSPHHPERRVARCDETGTTSMWVTANGMRDKYPEDGAWDDNEHIYRQEGVMSRANVFVCAQRLESGDTNMADLLMPFDDDEASA